MNNLNSYQEMLRDLHRFLRTASDEEICLKKEASRKFADAEESPDARRLAFRFIALCDEELAARKESLGRK